MGTVFDELAGLIDYVQSAYSLVTKEWLQNQTETINLKQTLVSDIDLNGVVYQRIMAYVQLLNEKSAYIALHFPFVCACQVTARVKAQNSIAYKIQNYRTERHEFGKVPIIKCINDLFGVRMILDTPLTFEEVRGFIERVYPGKYKCIDSSKLDYKAVHLYFKENNRTFPWELQIWNRCDVQCNFASHKKYKQEYTTWERESKEGGITHG